MNNAEQCNKELADYEKYVRSWHKLYAYDMFVVSMIGIPISIANIIKDIDVKSSMFYLIAFSIVSGFNLFRIIKYNSIDNNDKN